MRIGPNTRVTLHFALLLDTGEEVDSTRRGAPATFVMGDGSLPDGFERVLIGLAAGDDARLAIPSVDAFGERSSANLRRLRRAKFGPDLALEPGLVVSFAAEGGELPGVVVGVEGDSVDGGIVVIDFNHPLAGRALVFDVSVIRVESLT